jgi:hypothetical protein
VTTYAQLFKSQSYIVSGSGILLHVAFVLGAASGEINWSRSRANRDRRSYILPVTSCNTLAFMSPPPTWKAPHHLLLPSLSHCTHLLFLSFLALSSVSSLLLWIAGKKGKDLTMATPDHMRSGAPLLVWDCGSELYDSYELTAFQRQLDAAVLLTSGRSLSMPHLSGGTTPADVVRHQRRPGRRGDRRLTALLRRLFSKVIRLRLFPATAASRARGARFRTGDCGSVSGAGSPWSGSGALTSIPEEQSSADEKGSSPVEPAAPSALGKSQSERFIGRKTASSMVQFEVVS